ncbi:MAG: hypothetical protein ABIQ81_03755 [Novosphingobium sp.]
MIRQAAARLRTSNWRTFALFVLCALALRWASIGELGRHADETFYFLVGQRMHDGVLPYVDVWDRKPLGLFLIYYAIAGISTSVVAYQVVACLFAAATAAIISAIARPWTGERSAVLAGLAYLVIIGPFEGATGQAPDFYNPLIAGAALLLFGEAERLAQQEVGRRVWWAMGLCGLALTIKQTTAFEAAFFGFFVLVSLARAGASPRKIVRIAALCCAIGVLPTVLIGAYYAAVGHFAEYWHAMVLSNVAKVRESGGAWRALSIVVKAAPLLLLAAAGLFLPSGDRRPRLLIGAWIGAAVLGFLAVPNFYGHYILPVLVPLCVAAAFALSRIRQWIVPALAFAAYSFLWFNPFDVASSAENSRRMREMAGLIREHDRGGGLLVFDGPVYLYVQAGKPFLSPLVFPQHLNHQIENDVSHLHTREEIDRMLAAGPGVLVMSRFPRSFPVNHYSRGAVLAYARRNCRIVGVETADTSGDQLIIFGDCISKARRVGVSTN